MGFFSHTFDWLFKYFLNVFQIVRICIFGKQEFTLDFFEMVFEQFSAFFERFFNQGFAIEVQKVKGKNGHLNLKLE